MLALFEGRWGIGELAITVVLVAALIALIYIALTQWKIQIPEWAKQVFWVVVVATVIIIAIRFLLSL